MEALNRNYTSALVLNDTKKLLMQLKDGGYPFWPNCWATFGGGIKEDLETPFECMIREFDNETGIRIESFIPFYEEDFSDESKVGTGLIRDGRIYYFSAEISEADSRKIKITEGINYGFFNSHLLKNP